MDLLGEIKEDNDRLPAREPWKKRVAREIFAEVYSVMYVNVGRLKDRLRSSDSAQIVWRLGLAQLTGEDDRNFLSRHVAEIREIHEDYESHPCNIRLTRLLFGKIRVAVLTSIRGIGRGDQSPGSLIDTN